MKIYKDVQLLDKIISKIKENWGDGSRSGIHASDLLSPRKAYFQKVSPLPPTMKEIMYFLSGLAIETGLSELLGVGHAPSKDFNGILYTPDFYIDGITELKSRRAYLPEEGKEESVYGHYISQIVKYVAYEGQDKGNLIVMALNEKVDDGKKTEPQLVAYRLEFEQDELDEARESSIRMRDLLLEAIDTKDHTILPQCPAWMCGKQLKTMTKKPYCHTCSKEFETDWGIGKHLDAKGKANHVVTRAEYKYDFEPECKYYTFCNPVIGVK